MFRLRLTESATPKAGPGIENLIRAGSVRREGSVRLDQLRDDVEKFSHDFGEIPGLGDLSSTLYCVAYDVPSGHLGKRRAWPTVWSEVDRFGAMLLAPGDSCSEVAATRTGSS